MAVNIPRQPEAVGIVILDNPQHPTNALVQRRNQDRAWAPGRYAPLAGHISEEDYSEYQAIRAGAPSCPREMLYWRAALRELSEEIKPSMRALILAYAGSYNDPETGFAVHALVGYAKSRLEDKAAPITSKEEGPVEWKPIQDIEALIREGAMAGTRNYELAFDFLRSNAGRAKSAIDDFDKSMSRIFLEFLEEVPLDDPEAFGPFWGHYGRPESQE